MLLHRNLLVHERPSTSLRLHAVPQRRRACCWSTTEDSTQQTSTSSSGPPPLDPTQLVVWGGQQPAPRRLLVSGASAAAIALGANFLGVTSLLLGLDGGKLAGQLHLDVIVPVRGVKRCLDANNMFEFVYPAQWLADQTLVLRAAQRAEQERSLDLPPLAGGRSRAAAQPAKRVAEPTAAFGPPGSSGEENVSVIVAPIMQGFTLASLGAPRDAAAQFLSTIAPEGSSRQATLLDARSRVQDSGQGSTDGGELYYEMEYVIAGPGFRRHNISVYTARDGQLYTFNAQCPEALWPRDEAALRQSAESFRLLPRRTGSYR